MKKILAALAVLSTLALAGCGDVEVGGQKHWFGVRIGDTVASVCLNGHAFALYAGTNAGGITQIWENGPNGPRPMMCGGKEGGEGNE